MNEILSGFSKPTTTSASPSTSHDKMSSPKLAPILLLPFEVLQMIIHHLETPELLSMGSSCRQLRIELSASTELFSAVQTDFSDSHLEKLEAVFESSEIGHCVKKMIIKPTKLWVPASDRTKVDVAKRPKPQHVFEKERRRPLQLPNNASVILEKLLTKALPNCRSFSLYPGYVASEETDVEKCIAATEGDIMYLLFNVASQCLDTVHIKSFELLGELYGNMVSSEFCPEKLPKDFVSSSEFAKACSHVEQFTFEKMWRWKVDLSLIPQILRNLTNVSKLKLTLDVPKDGANIMVKAIAEPFRMPLTVLHLGHNGFEAEELCYLLLACNSVRELRLFHVHLYLNKRDGGTARPDQLWKSVLTGIPTLLPNLSDLSLSFLLISARGDLNLLHDAWIMNRTVIFKADGVIPEGVIFSRRKWPAASWKREYFEPSIKRDSDLCAVSYKGTEMADAVIAIERSMRCIGVFDNR
jgi:hypothetical protein